MAGSPLLWHLFNFIFCSALLFFCTALVIMPSKQTSLYSFFCKNTVAAGRHAKPITSCVPRDFSQERSTLTTADTGFYKQRTDWPLMTIENKKTDICLHANAAHVAYCKYLGQSISAGNDQSSLGLSWKPDEDTNPQQHDSPHLRHETEEPLPRHGWKQVWREFKTWGSSLPLKVILRPHCALQEEDPLPATLMFVWVSVRGFP